MVVIWILIVNVIGISLTNLLYIRRQEKVKPLPEVRRNARIFALIVWLDIDALVVSSLLWPHLRQLLGLAWLVTNITIFILVEKRSTK